MLDVITPRLVFSPSAILHKGHGSMAIKPNNYVDARHIKTTSYSVLGENTKHGSKLGH